MIGIVNTEYVTMCPPENEVLAGQICDYLTQMIASQVGFGVSGAYFEVEDKFGEDLD